MECKHAVEGVVMTEEEKGEEKREDVRVEREGMYSDEGEGGKEGGWGGATQQSNGVWCIGIA